MVMDKLYVGHDNYVIVVFMSKRDQFRQNGMSVGGVLIPPFYMKHTRFNDIAI